MLHCIIQSSLQFIQGWSAKRTSTITKDVSAVIQTPSYKTSFEGKSPPKRDYSEMSSEHSTSRACTGSSQSTPTIEDRDCSDDGTTVDSALELLDQKRQKRQKLIDEQHILENEIARPEEECQARHFFEKENKMDDKKKWVLPSGKGFDDVFFQCLGAKG